jgi:hypothetical protein
LEPVLRSGKVSGRAVRLSTLAPAHSESAPLAREQRAAEIARFRNAVAAALADLDRLAHLQETIACREWVEDRRSFLQNDAWIGRVTHLTDRTGIPAGTAAVRAAQWLESVVSSGGMMQEVANWVAMRLDGPREALPEKAVLVLERMSPAQLLAVDLLRPIAVVAAEVEMQGLQPGLPVVQAAPPPEGRRVVVDTASGLLWLELSAAGLPIVEPATVLRRWEDLAALALGAPLEQTAIGVDLDRLARNPLHPGVLHLLAAAARRQRLAVGGKAAYDPLLLPLWSGLGARGWFDPPGFLPDPPSPGVARACWKAAAACRTAAEVRRALRSVQRTVASDRA